ncbi:hypothetical protein G3M48_003443, partial [Beauveria asiatica]
LPMFVQFVEKEHTDLHPSASISRHGRSNSQMDAEVAGQYIAARNRGDMPPVQFKARRGHFVLRSNFRWFMNVASEIIRLHEMYQTLELRLGQEQKQNESLHRSIAELHNQLDESTMEKEVLERETDLLKDAL